MFLYRRCFTLLASVFLPFAVSGCGLYTPDKDPFSSDIPDPKLGYDSRQGDYEDAIVRHVLCELGQGLHSAIDYQELPWLKEWGTTVTQTITVEDQTGVAPGISIINPLQNWTKAFPLGGTVTSAQSFSTSIGGTGSVNSLRTETIQYTFKNSDIIKYTAGKFDSCQRSQRGLLIDGDLKIREFIYDKAVVARYGNASLVGEGAAAAKIPAFNTFTEEITFVAAYGASVTPTWKLARISANSSSNLIVSERTNTNDLIITLGPLLCAHQQDMSAAKVPDQCHHPDWGPVELSQAAMTQHNARVQASALATSVIGQTH